MSFYMTVRDASRYLECEFAEARWAMVCPLPSGCRVWRGPPSDRNLFEFSSEKTAFFIRSC